MFTQIFTCPRAIARHCAAPFAESRLRYLQYWAARGASRATLRLIAANLLAINTSLNLGAEGDISLAQIETAAERWIQRPHQHHRRKDSAATRVKFIATAQHWLRFLYRLHQEPVPPCPEAPLLAEFADYMAHERGWSPQTIRTRCLGITAFLRRVCGPHRPLRTVTIADIDHALGMKHRADGCARVTVQAYASVLRAFFRYGETRGWCTPGLAAAITAPRVFHGETLPAGPSWDDVRRLLAGTEGVNRTAIRDRAILLLLAVYGLRSSEVRRLRLDDLDWVNERITITRSKQYARTQVYPLTQPVGDAILRYVQEARPPCQVREIFVATRAPIQPLSNSAIWRLVSQRVRALNLPLRHCGPHALRHACASHLLSQGLSMKEIGDHLGHRSPAATAHYAKVDLVGLRQVADFSLGGLR
ncbi:MAG TPA: tyrosine-type recombinase/integrase [Candidatus Tectomicrobia bacterium]